MSTKIKHICGQCNQAFASEATYLKHICPALGRTPGNVEATTLSKAKAVNSLLEKNIIAAVQKARVTKRQYNA